MTSQRQLEEANYVHRGDDERYIQGLGQCGFGCNDFKLLKDNVETSIPYCTRFKMQVGYFDSCKYYNDEEMMELIGIMAKSMQKQKEAISSSRRKKRSKQYLITIIFIICILVFIWIKFK